MRTTVLFAALVSLFSTTWTAQAGRLDLVVIQFSDARDPAEIAESLSQVNLLDVTNSDRTETNKPGLRGGWVRFVQSLSTTPGSRFATSTRLGIDRADVQGSLNGGDLSVEITLREGVKVGLRKYRELIYSGRGSVAPGSARLISVQQSTAQTKTMKKNRPEMINTSITSIVAAQYTP